MKASEQNYIIDSTQIPASYSVGHTWDRIQVAVKTLKTEPLPTKDSQDL